MSAAIRLARLVIAAKLRAWRRRHPSRLRRLQAAHERDEMRRAERLAREQWGAPGDHWRRP